MAPHVQVILIICCTVTALAYAFVLMMWLVAKYKKQ